MKQQLITDCSICYYLDKRRVNKNGTYNLRLQVYSKVLGKRKYYSTIFRFSEKEFSSIWETVKPRKEYKQDRLKLQALESQANEVAESLYPFNFEDFERLLFNKVSTKKNINYYYSKTIEKHYAKESISTAKNYETALKCLLRYHNKPNIEFANVTVAWLEQFERFCTQDEGKTLTTVSIYLRTLRTIFNDAIEDKTLSRENYPFGKRKYRIPAPKKVKKSLDKNQLKILLEGQPLTSEQEKAKAFWFFSYLCNGINFKDILHLKCKNLEGDKLEFVRAKTAKTAQNQATITVYLIPYAKDILNKYGNPNGSPFDYIFPLLEHNQTATEQYRKVKNFIRLTNQHFLKYAKANGIEEKISSYWARHSFTTMAIRNGASIEMVGEAVGHSNIKTTMGYFAGFEDKTKKDLSSNLLKFD